jgi:N-formylglutamate amidohydrolase
MTSETYWRPYHDRLLAELGDLKARFGYALLWDAHSIPGEVPLLFDGALPDLNIGTNGRKSCAEELEIAVMAAAQESTYSFVLNGRFQGGFITRHYGDPDADVHAMQLELTQRRYMDEKTLAYSDRAAAQLRETIGSMLVAFMESAKDVYAD